MTNLADHPTQELNKVLLIGNPGAGKTGALGSLANAGYRLLILDMDGGLDILLDPMVVSKESRKNVFFKTCQDTVSGPKAIPVHGAPFGVQTAMNTLDGWREGETELGSMYDWREKDVLVIDSLTMFGESAMRFVLSVSGFSGQPPRVQHWGDAIRIQENLLASLFSNSVKCNVVVTAHITYIETKDERPVGLSRDKDDVTIVRGYPSALGQKLPPKVGRYFNSVLMVEKRLLGSTVQRYMRTSASSLVDLKSPAPSVVATEMEPDLAKYFALVRTKERAR